MKRFRNPPPARRRLAAMALLATMATSSSAVAAETAGAPATERLSFGEIFRRPVGARGLEPTGRLLALAGQRVRMSGFAVRGGDELPGTALLAAMPVVLGDEDETLADDLPAAVVYLHESAAGLAQAVRRCPSRAEVEGVLEIGPHRESDQRISYLRLKMNSVRCP